MRKSKKNNDPCVEVVLPFGVALFGRGVVCRIVPGSQLVGFRRGVLVFLVGVVCRGGLCGPWCVF